MGVSARTGISVNRQFLDFLSTQLYHPKTVRVDLDSKTSMIADGHLPSGSSKRLRQSLLTASSMVEALRTSVSSLGEAISQR